MPPHRYASLDGLRGIMAILVMMGHLGMNTPLKQLGINVQFQLAVDFFFVLSGFVLSATSYFGRKYFFEFLVGRIFRLWPLHLLTTCAALLAIRSPCENMLANIFFLQGIGIKGFFSINFPAWSVSVEFWISIFMMILCLKINELHAIGLGIAGIFAMLIFSEIRH